MLQLVALVAHRTCAVLHGTVLEYWYLYYRYSSTVSCGVARDSGIASSSTLFGYPLGRALHRLGSLTWDFINSAIS